MKKISTFLFGLFLCVSAFSAPSAALIAVPSVVAATAARNSESSEHSRLYHKSTLEPEKVFICRTVVKEPSHKDSNGEKCINYNLVDVYEERIYYSCGEHCKSAKELNIFVRTANEEEVKQYEFHRFKLRIICAIVIIIVILATVLLIYSEVYNDSTGSIEYLDDD